MKPSSPYPKHPLLEGVIKMLNEDQSAAVEKSDAASEKGRDDEFVTSISQAMEKLSHENRNQAQEEIRGTLETPDETVPGFVSSKLDKMEQAIFRISTKQAYDIAVGRSPGYVKDASFRLQFLRAERFDAKLAALRMVRYFEVVREFFGDAAVGRPLTLQDLNNDDWAIASSGRAQILSRRDRAGRLVLFDMMGHDFKTVSNVTKFLFYMFTRLAEDVETSRKGLTLVVYTLDGKDFAGLDLATAAMRITKAVPLRQAAAHVCLSEATNPVVQQMLNFLGEKMRIELITRTMIHNVSTIVECKHSLMSLGIPVDAIPITDSGRIKTKDHLKWIERQRFRETMLAQMGFFDGIEWPLPRDVLGGKGKPNQEYIGNRHMKELVEARFSEYDDCQDTDKKRITEEVVEKVLRSGGRFLAPREADGGLFWEEVSKEKARERVSICFRSLRAKKRRRVQGRQTIHESGANELSVSSVEGGCCGV